MARSSLTRLFEILSQLDQIGGMLQGKQAAEGLSDLGTAAGDAAKSLSAMASGFFGVRTPPRAQPGQQPEREFRQAVTPSPERDRESHPLRTASLLLFMRGMVTALRGGQQSPQQPQRESFMSFLRGLGDTLRGQQPGRRPPTRPEAVVTPPPTRPPTRPEAVVTPPPTREQPVQAPRMRMPTGQPRPVEPVMAETVLPGGTSTSRVTRPPIVTPNVVRAAATASQGPSSSTRVNQAVWAGMTRILPRVTAGLARMLPVLAPLAVAGYLGEKLVKAGSAAAGFVLDLEKAAARLRDVSPDMAMIFTRSDFRRLQRQVQSGSRRAASTEGLVDALDDLRSDVQPTLDAIVNLLNIIAIGVTRGAQGAYAASDEIAAFAAAQNPVTNGIWQIAKWAWEKWGQDAPGNTENMVIQMMKGMEDAANADRRARGGRDRNFFKHEP